MRDYSVIGFDKNLRKGLASSSYQFTSAFDDDINIEKTPYLNPTALSKGTVLINLGGVLTLRDTTGGTVLLTVNPDNGTVTINGGIRAGVTVNIGTLNDPTINGVTAQDGTLVNNNLISNAGTLRFTINAGSPALSTNGDFAIETHTGSAVLVARHGGTTFYFTSAGTLA